MALPLTVLVAAMLAAARCVALVLYWPGAFDSLGIYLFLLVAAPVLLQADSYTAVDNMAEFCMDAALFAGLLHHHPGKRRPAGAFTPQYPAGPAVAMSIRTEAAEQPFFGLILSGFLLAVLRAVEATLRRAIHRRRQAETVGKEAEA